MTYEIIYNEKADTCEEIKFLILFENGDHNHRLIFHYLLCPLGYHAHSNNLFSAHFCNIYSCVESCFFNPVSYFMDV